jgi:hypothetical protein
MPEERQDGPVHDHDADEPVDSNELYGLLLSLASGTPAFLIEAHALRGRRLFVIRTELSPTLQGFNEIVNHATELEDHFSADAELTSLTFLVQRFRADVEIAVEALLGGRHGVLAAAMRDVMELELLLRDFSFDTAHIVKWLTCDEATRVGYFSPGQVRHRLAMVLYPGQNVDLPDAVEYTFHSKGTHATPNSPPDFDNVLSTESEPGRLLFYSFEIVEHARRFFAAVYRLMRTLNKQDWPLLDREMPGALEAWELSTKAIQEGTANLPPGAFSARKPQPRQQRNTKHPGRRKRP